MAAMLTVVVRAPLTSILLVFELTGSYGMVLPLMLASIIAAVIAERLHPGSVYAAALRSKGIHLLQREDRDVLDTVAVRDVMTWVPTVNPASPVSELQAIMTDAGHHGVPVVDDEERLVGIVTLTDLDAVAETDPAEDIPVAQIMTKRPVTASPTMPVSAALARMASLGLGRLPVVDSSGALVGMFRRESVVRGYHRALSKSASNELYRARVNLRSNRHAEFFEITVRDGSPIANKLVKDIAWPPEATLVSVRRHQRVIIPHGQTTVRMGDELTIYCKIANRGPVWELVEPPQLTNPFD
jgi:CBS domain-containing protein